MLGRKSGFLLPIGKKRVGTHVLIFKDRIIPLSIHLELPEGIAPSGASLYSVQLYIPCIGCSKTDFIRITVSGGCRSYFRPFLSILGYLDLVGLTISAFPFENYFADRLGGTQVHVDPLCIRPVGASPGICITVYCVGSRQAVLEGGGNHGLIQG